MLHRGGERSIQSDALCVWSLTLKCARDLPMSSIVSTNVVVIDRLASRCRHGWHQRRRGSCGCSVNLFGERQSSKFRRSGSKASTCVPDSVGPFSISISFRSSIVVRGLRLLKRSTFDRFCLLSAFRKASSNELLEIEVSVVCLPIHSLTL